MPKPQPKSQPNKAAEVLRATLISSTTNQPMDEAIGIFVNALKEVDPDRLFTVVDIVSWATEYRRQDPDVKLPDELFNSYSLGKYLKGSCNELGISPQGTYGNRQVWGLKHD